ncbi:hypothetical protein AGMMS49949_05040 [Alphaproteobacteria bacterium]|nr:hypothetical protein AGMMS49949_05040 [Alphaproteobacteria bacterium]GHS97305.1 hypothetical protein AGMMS50296_4190 [Alphaproteobacteria bacterium]
MDSLYALPSDWIPGNSQQGYAILNGFFLHQDENKDLFQKSWHDISDIFVASDYFLTYLCRFDWLCDLRATGDMSARRLARRTLEFWMDHKLYKKTYKKLKKNAVFVLAARLSVFMALYDFVGSSAKESWKKAFFKNLQSEYRFLKKKFRNIKKTSVRFAALRALLNYNVFCVYDAAFFVLLLDDLYEVLARFEREETPSPHDLYRDMNVALGLRNTFLQWEKMFLKRDFYYRSLYQKTMHALRDFLQKSAQKTRWSRHSHGELCQLLAGGQSCFFEPLSSQDVDGALFQIEEIMPSMTPINEGLAKGTNRKSIVFIHCQKKAPAAFVLENYEKNNVDQVMELEWSVQSHLVLQGSFQAFFQKNKKLTERRRELGQKSTFAYENRAEAAFFAFQGHLSDQRTYAWRRDITLAAEEDILAGNDTFWVHEESEEPLLVTQFFLGKDMQVADMTHEPGDLCGDISFELAPKKKELRQKAKRLTEKKSVCLLKVESDRQLSLKTRKTEKVLIVTILSALSTEEKNTLHWSFYVKKDTL